VLQGNLFLVSFSHIFLSLRQDSIVLQSVFTNAREKLSKEWEDNDEPDEPEDSVMMDDDEPIAPSSR
jgi:hypothetical protein